MDRNNRTLSIDHIGLAAAEKSKHVGFDVNLLAHGVVCIDDEIFNYQ